MYKNIKYNTSCSRIQSSIGEEFGKDLELCDAVGESRQSVDQTYDLMSVQFKFVDVVGQQNLEGSAQSVGLHFAPKATLITGDTIHDICRDIVEVLSELLRHSWRLVFEQNRFVEVIFEFAMKNEKMLSKNWIAFRQ